uniref:Uncharacterized protein n=1 Tax=Leersia perrieri TaxID=77586 RepID=A0A0D9WDC4_9ORYZ
MVPGVHSPRPAAPTAAASLPRPRHMLVLGTGFVGRYVSQQLLAQGWRVSGTCTSPAKKTELEMLGVDASVFDATSSSCYVFESVHMIADVCVDRDDVTWPRDVDQFYNEKLIVEVLKIGVGVRSRNYGWILENRWVSDGEVIAGAIWRLMGDGKAIRRKAPELAVKAKGAPKKGGSSYDHVGRLMEAPLMARRSSVDV